MLLNRKKNSSEFVTQNKIPSCMAQPIAFGEMKIGKLAKEKYHKIILKKYCQKNRSHVKISFVSNTVVSVRYGFKFHW